jgi:hypothetical protein
MVRIRIGLRVAQQGRMTTKTRIITALLWSSLMAPAIVLASGCNWLGLSCTQVGCDDQVSVSLRGLEADQFYEVEIATEDDIILCTIDTSVEPGRPAPHPAPGPAIMPAFSDAR